MSTTLDAMTDAVRIAHLKWSPAIGKETAHIYERMKRVMPEAEWMAHAPYVHAINILKRERNAVILAHNYQVPEIYHGVADVGPGITPDLLTFNETHVSSKCSRALCFRTFTAGGELHPALRTFSGFHRKR